jgi:hypothetical protein
LPRSPRAQRAARPEQKSFSQVSCSLTAEAGRISRGPSAPQRSAPALIFLGPIFLTSFLLLGFLLFVFRFSNFDFRISNFAFPHFPYLPYLLYLFSPPTTGRIFPAAILPNARSRSFNSLLSNRPSRYSHRRKSSARRSPFSELHSEQLETRLR